MKWQHVQGVPCLLPNDITMCTQLHLAKTTAVQWNTPTFINGRCWFLHETVMRKLLKISGNDLFVVLLTCVVWYNRGLFSVVQCWWVRLFQALMVWDVNTTTADLSKSLPNSHKDWITSCVWTSDCVVKIFVAFVAISKSCRAVSYRVETLLCCMVFICPTFFLFQISSSNDGRLCLWDLQAGQRLKEISWRSPLTSVCCLVCRWLLLDFVLFPRWWWSNCGPPAGLSCPCLESLVDSLFLCA